MKRTLLIFFDTFCSYANYTNRKINEVSEKELEIKANENVIWLF